jgi:hypothetical protein
MKDVLEHYEPERKYVSRVSGGGRIFRVEAAIKPSANGTEMVLL